MVLCRREVTVTTAWTALIKSSVSHAYLNKAIIWGLFIGCWDEKVVCLLYNGGGGSGTSRGQMMQPL